MDEELERFITLVSKTGRMIVSQDVYDSFKQLPSTSDCWDRLGLLEIIVNPCLPSGSAVAVKFEGSKSIEGIGVQ
ncbi:MAG: hypothetical protein KGL39_00430 [Patescibacteria group bacterium]|nr:hypothetical protein [Patescibacteria group bacterium]